MTLNDPENNAVSVFSRLWGQIKDPTIRAVRTYFQVFIGLLIVNWAAVETAESLETGLSVVGTAAVTAVPAVLSFIQNLLEDSTGKDKLKGI